MTQPGLKFSGQLLAGLLGAQACFNKSSLATSQTLPEKNVTGDLEYQHRAKAVRSPFPARTPQIHLLHFPKRVPFPPAQDCYSFL